MKLINTDRKFEIGYLLGAIKGDGFIGKNTEKQKMIMLSVKSKDFCETFRNCLFSICGRKYKVSKVKNYKYNQGYCWVTRCTNQNAVDFFENFDIYNLVNSTDDVKIGFLQGIFDAEGCSFCKYYLKRQSYTRIVAIFNKNKKLLELCQSLLKSFEIKTRKISKEREIHSLHLEISKENLNKFKKQVGFSIPEKNLYVEKCLRSYKGDKN